jgi:predicted nucleotidyltransferase
MDCRYRLRLFAGQNGATMSQEAKMDREAVLQILRSNEPELKAAGIAQLRLFGSVARGEQNENSDIDLMADLDPAIQASLWTMGELQYRLDALLGTDVDLSFTSMMREHIRKRALREAIVAF